MESSAGRLWAELDSHQLIWEGRVGKRPFPGRGSFCPHCIKPATHSHLGGGKPWARIQGSTGGALGCVEVLGICEVHMGDPAMVFGGC